MKTPMRKCASIHYSHINNGKSVFFCFDKYKQTSVLRRSTTALFQSEDYELSQLEGRHEKIFHGRNSKFLCIVVMLSCQCIIECTESGVTGRV